MVVILDTRWSAVGITRNPFKIRGALSCVIFPTNRSRSLGYVLDGGGEPEHTWTCLFHELYDHAQQFYYTILSRIANYCGRYKLIWTVSCFGHNIAHPSCCKLAQVVALSSPPFNVKLSVWLSPSCNAVPLIAKATTQLKEMAVRQPITQYQILCCYRVSRPGLLNVHWQTEL
jgi:hypothetical protein